MKPYCIFGRSMKDIDQSLLCGAIYCLLPETYTLKGFWLYKVVLRVKTCNYVVWLLLLSYSWIYVRSQVTDKNSQSVLVDFELIFFFTFLLCLLSCKLFDPRWPINWFVAWWVLSIFKNWQIMFFSLVLFTNKLSAWTEWAFSTSSRLEPCVQFYIHFSLEINVWPWGRGAFFYWVQFLPSLEVPDPSGKGWNHRVYSHLATNHRAQRTSVSQKKL